MSANQQSSARPVRARGGAAIAAIAVVGLCAFLFSAASAGAAQAPWWHVTSRVAPSTLKPGGEGTIVVQAVNVGDSTTSGPVKLSDALPAGLTLQKTEFFASSIETGIEDLGPGGFLAKEAGIELCETSASGASCSTEDSAQEEILPPLIPFEYLEMRLTVSVAQGAASGGKNQVEIEGGHAATAATSVPVAVSEALPAFGTESYTFVPEEEGGGVDVRAGSHPFQLTTSFTLNQTGDPVKPPALPQHLRFELPAGFIGNTTALTQCSDLDFRHLTEGGVANLCPGSSAIGVASVTVDTGVEADYVVPVFNLAPEHGEPARLGFEIIGIPITLDTSVRTGGDYGITVDVNNITQLATFQSTTLTLWGVPGEANHDEARGWGCILGEKFSKESGQKCVPAEQSQPAPFLTLPTSCEGSFTTTVEGQAWPTQSEPAGASFTAFPYTLEDQFARQLHIAACDQLPFEPSIEVQPDGQAASTPTGLAARVRVPQEVNENGSGLASSSVKDISVSLPEGVTLNPAGAGGLEACSEEQIGYLPGESAPAVGETHFTPTVGSPFCPSASKVGTARIKVPVIKNPLVGAVYLATQNSNPFGSLVAMYIVAEDKESGVLVKLPGEVSLSEAGHISATFKNTPQAPFEEAELNFFGGSRAPLSTPSHCGTYTTNTSFTPWSGGPAVNASSHFEITSGVGGPSSGPCPSTLPFAPSLAAGTTNLQAGAFSPLVTTISREDGNQDIQTVQLHMPPGLSGILAGVPLCPEAQANAGTCSQASLIGHTTVSVGLGNEPFSVVGGEVFLTEKVAGSPADAPFGLSIVNPAVAGPFNLGKVVVRATVAVDPHTAALTVTTGVIPHILDGIPLQIKHVNVTIDRAGFTFNPTNCAKTAVTGSIGSVEGASSPVAVPFQVTNCANLKFSPKFTVSTAGKNSKAGGATLTAKLSYPNAAQGTQANITRVKVDLPKQLPSRLTTLQKACTNAQFELNPANCPKDSKIGFAKVTTPLLPVPLEGPAIFVSHGGEAFPSLTMVLQGAPPYNVNVDLVGTTNISKAGITSTTFKTVPDVPFNTFTLTLPQGKFSALAANVPGKDHYSLCGQALNMPTEFLAQNGAKISQSTKISVTGCKKAKKTVKKKAKKKKKGK